MTSPRSSPIGRANIDVFVGTWTPEDFENSQASLYKTIFLSFSLPFSPPAMHIGILLHTHYHTTLRSSHQHAFSLTLTHYVYNTHTRTLIHISLSMLYLHFIHLWLIHTLPPSLALLHSNSHRQANSISSRHTLICCLFPLKNCSRIISGKSWKEVVSFHISIFNTFYNKINFTTFTTCFQVDLIRYNTYLNSTSDYLNVIHLYCLLSWLGSGKKAYIIFLEFNQRPI